MIMKNRLLRVVSEGKDTDNGNGNIMIAITVILVIVFMLFWFILLKLFFKYLEKKNKISLMEKARRIQK